MNTKKKVLILLKNLPEIMEVFYKYLTQERLQDAIQYAQKNIQLREGMLDFSHKMNDVWVPLIISSAWVSNVIEWVLDHNALPHKWIHGNSLKFDAQGKFAWLNNDCPVYTDDKTWDSLPKYLTDAFSDRSHILVMWDAVWDIKIWPSDRSTMNVGFLLWEQKWYEEAFRKTFDHIIESDTCDRGFLDEVILKLQY